MLCTFSSCSNDEHSVEEVENKTVIKSTLSSEAVSETIDKIDKMYEDEIRTRSVNGEDTITETQVAEVLAPFIEEGKFVRQQIIADIRDNPSDYSLDAEAVLTQMQDEHLAELGFIVSDFNNRQAVANIKIPKWLDCFGSVFGLGKDGIKAYINGTKSLMTAQTAWAIVRSFAKRTLGIIGAAWAMYDYYHCMNG